MTRAAAAAIAILAFVAGLALRSDPNESATYNDGGEPKNCRAIVAVAIELFRRRQESQDQTLDFLDRNCGLFGYSWSGGLRYKPVGTIERK